jgi:hypothetical protein
MIAVSSRPSAPLIIRPCSNTALASAGCRAPSARATQAEMPAPTEPPEIVPISMTKGNTKAMPASASLPSFASHQVSISAVAA